MGGIILCICTGMLLTLTLSLLLEEYRRDTTDEYSDD
jgi:hypothetical protein